MKQQVALILRLDALKEEDSWRNPEVAVNTGKSVVFDL